MCSKLIRARIKLKGREGFLDLDSVRKVSFSCKILGLMFRSRRNAEALLFDFKKPTAMAIHSFFVFFPFVAVWLNDKNEVIECQIVRPWIFHVKPKSEFTKLIELPFNKKYEGVITQIFKNS